MNLFDQGRLNKADDALAHLIPANPKNDNFMASPSFG